MSFRFTNGIFKICVAQICQNIGWHAVQTSPMDILMDVLHRYMLELSKAVGNYSNQYGRTEPNLDDVALTFKDFGISLSDIEEYVNNVEPVPFVHKLPALPLVHPSHLQHPKSGSRELQHRPEHINEHLPLMHPELEEEEGALSPSFDSGSKKISMDSSGTGEGESSPLSSPKHGTKRPGEWPGEMPASKKARHMVEEEGRPMREVTSVFMTPSGFISPAREGKVADSSLPNTIDSPPSTPETNTSTTDGTASKKESKSKDSKKDKSSKSKKEKDRKKEALKSKTSKKENKENTALASEKHGSTFSSKKEHSSHKSSGKTDKGSKSGDSSRQKIKNDKSKFKEGKDDHKKNRDHFKVSKSKSKLKHASTSFSKSPKSSKLSKSPQKSIVKSPKKASSKSPRQEKKLTVSPPVVAAPVVKPPEKKEEVPEVSFPKFEMKKVVKTDLYDDSILSDSPDQEESRLVIDMTNEAQSKLDQDSRIAMVDACITAVIQRAQEESELEVEKSQKEVDKTIDEVIRGPVMRRLEPKDIYDFTDSSELSSLSSLDDDSPLTIEDKYKSSDSEKSFESVKKEKVKVKQHKKVRDLKKSSGSLASPKTPKSPNVIVKRAERTPSPIKLRDEMGSSDESNLSRSPSPASFFDIPQTSQKKLPPAPSLSEISLQPSPFAASSTPSTSFSSNPFAPIRPLPCQIQSNPHFPTRPLFQTSKSEQSSSFHGASNAQPLNLAKPSSLKNSPEEKTQEPNELLHSKSDDDSDAVDSKSTKSEVFGDKSGKSKLHRKDKDRKEKIDKKDKFKKKNKDKKEKEKDKFKVKEKEKEKEVDVVVKPRERGRPRLLKNLKKDEKTKVKSVKRKDRDEKEDSSVPKFTLKLTSANSGAGKFLIKPSAKSPPSSPVSMKRKVSLSPPRTAATLPPSPPRPPSPPPPPPAVASPVPSPIPSPLPTLAADVSAVTGSSGIVSTRGGHSRGRGRGRKPNAQPAARTVITETLGTMVDEKGNKIWICPACTRVDDGSAMIGCDSCDDWYHWECVGIYSCPDTEHWYCTRCISKRKSVPLKRRRKKHK